MSPRHWETLPKYPGHAEHSRRALFAKDREITKLSDRARKAESALEFIAEVVSGRIGGRDDPAWMIATIEEALSGRVTS